MISRRFALIALSACIVTSGLIHASSRGLDPSFGDAGRVITEALVASYPSVGIAALAAAPDGTLVAAGDADVPGGGRDFAVARYSPDGQLLSAVTLDLQSDPFMRDHASHVAIQPDGRIVVAGTTQDSPDWPYYDVAVVRLLPALTLDPTFGTAGIVIIPGGMFSEAETVSGLALQADGRIVVADVQGLTRLDVDGRLDLSFGAGGRVSPVFASPSNERVAALALQPDGRILVVGNSVDLPSLSWTELSAARYMSDGSPDMTFGIDGKAHFSGYTARPAAVDIQPDGRIVVAGARRRGDGSYHVCLWRLDADGPLDGSFGDQGRVFTIVGAHDSVGDVAVQPDGRIVVAGGSDGGNYFTSQFTVLRYLPDGRPDPELGPRGLIRTDFFRQMAFANAVVLQPEGRIVLGGGASVAGNWAGFALAGYLIQPPNQPPVITSPAASPDLLWPANHKLIDVTVSYAVSDDSGLAPACSLAVTSNELVDGDHDGGTSPDWVVVDPHLVRLRAERSSAGTGRIYTVTIGCVDAGGLEALSEVTVSAPLSR